MITVNQMIKQLQDSVKDDPKFGECPLYVYADHAQTYIQADDLCFGYAHDYDYYIEECDPDNVILDKRIAIIGD